MKSSLLLLAPLMTPGASARSFIEKGHWGEALLQPLENVSLHFGGNDQKWGGRYGDRDGSYRDYLRAFLPMARARGILGTEEYIPVIDLHAASIAPEPQSMLRLTH